MSSASLSPSGSKPRDMMRSESTSEPFGIVRSLQAVACFQESQRTAVVVYHSV